MSSPFTDAKEFLEARGPIYTFANNSAIISILLVLSFAITVYFFYASYAICRKENSRSSDSTLMSVLLIAGLTASLSNSLINNQKKPGVTARRQEPQQHGKLITQNKPPMELLLGLIGSGSAWGVQHRSLRKRRRRRRL